MLKEKMRFYLHLRWDFNYYFAFYFSLYTLFADMILSLISTGGENWSKLNQWQHLHHTKKCNELEDCFYLFFPQLFFNK